MQITTSTSRSLRITARFAASLSLGLALAACDSSEPAAKAPVKAVESHAAPAAAAAAASAKPDAEVAKQTAPAAPTTPAAPAKPDAPAATAAKSDAPAAASPSGNAVAASGDAVAQVDAFIASKNIDKSGKGWKSSLPKPELASFDKGKTYFWDLKTNKGDMRFKLLPEYAPMHVTNCIYLTRLGFYDGTTMHRVIKNFMAQGGCPLGNGTGNPGYKINLELSPKLKHDKRGVLSTANSGPNTDGSQYFIMFKANAGLDGGYSIYGEIVSGLDTLEKIEAVGKNSDPAPPSESLVIEKASISVE